MTKAVMKTEADDLAYESRRARERLKPVRTVLAYVFEDGEVSDIPKFIGLVLNYSENGCGVASLNLSGLKVDSKVTVKVGEGDDARSGLIRWCMQIDKDIYKFGIKYFS